MNETVRFSYIVVFIITGPKTEHSITRTILFNPSFEPREGEESRWSDFFSSFLDIVLYIRSMDDVPFVKKRDILL